MLKKSQSNFLPIACAVSQSCTGLLTAVDTRVAGAGVADEVGFTLYTLMGVSKASSVWVSVSSERKRYVLKCIGKNTAFKYRGIEKSR